MQLWKWAMAAVAVASGALAVRAAESDGHGVAPATMVSDTGEPYSVRMAEGLVKRYPKGINFEQRKPTDEPKWSYSVALAVRGIGEVGLQKGKPELVKYAQDYADAFVREDGTIDPKKYQATEYRLDDVAPGVLLLMLSQQVKSDKYLKAAEELSQQFAGQPRNPDGGFWHKKNYPHQMWADGIYMGSPFMAEYAYLANQPKFWDEAATQVVLFANHALDEKTHLVWHGYDDSKTQQWADKTTGLSPNFWGRADGWYAMALVDVLDYLPAKHPQRGAIVKILQELADGIERVQDKDTGVWWQVLDKPTAEGNYREASASCMFVYALAKGARLGYLEPHYGEVARRGFAGVVKEFVRNDPQTGGLMLIDTCSVAGLGSASPNGTYRDGSVEYYVGEPKAVNDTKGLGAFLLASLEEER